MTPAQIGDAINPRRDRRTIERELRFGLVEQRRTNTSYKRNEPLYVTEMGYKAGTAQKRHEERAANKGRGLKIGNDQRLSDYIESKIKDGKCSPGLIIGRIRSEGMQFKTTICTKTVYNYIDKGIYREVTNKDLWVKKNGGKIGDVVCLT